MSAPVFDALRFQAASFDVIAASHAPPSLLAQRQTSRLERLLQAAQQGSAFYRERLPATPVAADFARVQPVMRDELMQRFADWVTDPALQLDELRGFTAGLARVGEGFKGYMAWESSGTSGRPGVFVQDAATLAVYDALEAVR
ncbi:MAG: phenylacetate--CoA ligase family protein, partial [Ottowia sp.]|nr:phenylacetate--CoA ligase family protein [Ottowia sp.]